MFSKLSDTKVHFIGIGGIGMSGIAEVLLRLGFKVSGSDQIRSANTDKLTSLGADVYICHKAKNIRGATVVVYSSAISKDNPEIKASIKNEIPVMRRAEILAELMRLKRGIAIAGTHGKTTTTSILATILRESKYDPTYIIGGIVKNLDGHAHFGHGEFLVAEADESDGSFLNLSPELSIITNIDDDHIDYYGSQERILEAFESFANKIPFYGLCALNISDLNVRKLKEKLRKPHLTFCIRGKEKLGADYEAANLNIDHTGTNFDLYVDGKWIDKFSICLPGEHNVLNALGGILIANKLGVDFPQIKSALSTFRGVGRRFQHLYKFKEFEIIDDYAHHPTEIVSTLEALRQAFPAKKIIAVFEPHRFTRTKDCWNQFLHCFNKCDRVFIGPVYAASELPIPGIETTRLINDINSLHPKLAIELKSMMDLEKVISDFKSQDVCLITLGAGSIGRVVREIIGNLSD